MSHKFFVQVKIPPEVLPLLLETKDKHYSVHTNRPGGGLPMTGILLCSCVRFPLRQFTRHKCSLNILEFSSNECL